MSIRSKSSGQEDPVIRKSPASS